MIGYPVNHVLEHSAAAGIRPIIVRQERTGLHMATAISRVTSGDQIGAFCMQHGPCVENSYGSIAQAYSESVPNTMSHLSASGAAVSISETILRLFSPSRH